MSNDLVSSRSPQEALVAQSLADLAHFSGFSHAQRIDELFTRAMKNLEAKMMDGQIMAEDPTMVLDAFKALHKSQLDILDARRKVAETMVRAQAMYSPPRFADDDDPLPNNIQDAETDVVVDISADIAASASPAEPGLFGSLAK